MTVQDMIDKLDEKIYKIKYYSEDLTKEFLNELIEDLKQMEEAVHE